MGPFDFLTSGNASKTLMTRMMTRFGVDRQLRRLPGHGAATARAVERCSRCGHDEECASWLANNDDPAAPPEFCRNSDLIARLRDSVETAP